MSWDPFRPSVLRPRRRRVRRAIGILVIAAIVGGGATAAAIVIPSIVKDTKEAGAPKETLSPTAVPKCATARAAAPEGTRLGVLAWIRDGKLQTFDMDACHTRTLVESDAAPPVRFSHDGRWVAFGDAAVVAANGGDVLHPIGSAAVWQWSPADDVLAGVTAQGGVQLGGPNEAATSLLPDGAGAGHLAFSPDGKRLALDIGGDRVEVLDVSSGQSQTVYRVSSGAKASPEVVGWSADGKWALFWSHFAKQPAGPLNAAPAGGGNWMNVYNLVLPYPDFLSPCGSDIAIAGGSKGQPSKGNQILVSSPPQWHFHNLSADFLRSWIWPACSPNGKWVAATATPNRAERPPGYGVRSLWLLSTEGKDRQRLSDAPTAAFEAPRWSADGRFLMVVRRGLEPRSTGQVLLIPVSPATGKPGHVVGPLENLGSAPGHGGHTDWSAVSDWFRPPAEA